MEDYKKIWKDFFEKRGGVLGTERIYTTEDDRENIGSVLKHTIEAYGLKFFKGKRILDYGCGIGRFVDMFLKAGNKYTGLDLTKVNIEHCKKTYPDNTFIEVDGDSLPLEDNSIDVIFTSTVLQHIPENMLLKLKAEFDRILDTNGSMILFENTAEIVSDSIWVFFRPWTYYKKLFDFVDLQREIDITDRGNERHTLMIGRRK